MARVEEDAEEPPEEIQVKLRAVFRPPFPIHHTYVKLSWMNKIVTRRGRPRKEPPYVPSQKQMGARYAFAHAAELLEAAPQNEKHAYWLLAQAENQHYGNFYRERWISPIYHGTPDEQIVRPNTWTVQPTINGYTYDPPFYLVRRATSADELTIRYDMEADPGTAKTMNLRYSGDDGFSHDDFRTFQYAIIERIEYEVWPTTRYRVHMQWNPTTRGRLWDTLVSPAVDRAITDRFFYLYQNTVENSVICVAWFYELDGDTTTVNPWCFEQNTEIH